MRIICRGLLIAILPLVLFLTSCSTPEPITVYGVTLSANSVVFDCFGGDKAVTVSPFPESEEWQLVTTDTDSEWVEAKAEQGAVRISASVNRSAEVRSTSFVITSPKGNFEERVVTISQEAAPLSSITTSAKESYEFDSEGGNISFTVISNGEWEVSSSNTSWLTVTADQESGLVTLSASRNEGEEVKEAVVTISCGDYTQKIATTQQTVANNPYLRLVGQWEITASKWFYSPNGSLNSLDYNPNPSDYYLIFSIEQGEYGRTLVMKDFLYPGTELTVNYDKESGGFVIPFGWTVLSYDVFLYITVVNDKQFSYASLEVEATPLEDDSALTLDMPAVSGFNYVGFGLWTYDENGYKEAFGSQYRPTMFPMGEIVFRKQS